MKTLSERIADRVKNKTTASPHANRAVVLALRNDIQLALDDGWSVLAIYRALSDEGRIAFSYQAFRRYVNQIHLGKRSLGALKVEHIGRDGSPRSVSLARGFGFDPAPKKEDLL